MNRIITISIDLDQNRQVKFDNLEEVIFDFLAALGIECVVNGMDEEIPEEIVDG